MKHTELPEQGSELADTATDAHQYGLDGAGVPFVTRVRRGHVQIDQPLVNTRRLQTGRLIARLLYSRSKINSFKLK